MGDCGKIGSQQSLPVYSGNVLWNGNSFPCITFPPNSTLNDVMALIGIYLCNITIPIYWQSANVAMSINLPCGGTIIGDSLDEWADNVDKMICSIDLTKYVAKSLYDANTILYATTDDTPVVLTIPTNTVVGRLSGNIQTLTAANLRTLLNIMDVDTVNSIVFPYNTGYTYAVGANSTADKLVMVFKESATFSDNPYIGLYHSRVTAGDYCLEFLGNLVADVCQSVNAAEAISTLQAITTGTTAAAKNQQIMLFDQATNTASRRGWYIRKDGADSRSLKFIYYNGAAYTTIFKITTGGYFQMNATTAILGVLDDDLMLANSAVHTITQQSFLAYFAAHAVSQVEMDATQVGAGLNTDGSYTPPVASNYLSGSTSLNNADSILDAKIKIINDDIDAKPSGAGFLELCAKAKFTYSQQTTTGTIGLIGSLDIPDNAIITSFRCDVITAFTDDGTNISTLGIGIENTGVGTEDLKHATVIGTDFTATLKADTWNNYSHATPFKLTSARDITVNVVLGGAATHLSTGELYVYVTYFITE